jgi:F0F1-type ATP synthase membrane subunit c/vacuolar-type H+-ATPase subunit K
MANFGQNNLFYPFVTFNNAGSGARLGQQRDAWYSKRHGDYYGSVYGIPALGAVAAVSGAVFSGANASTTTLSVGLATTYTGICLSNPAASTVNLVARKTGITVSATSAANAFGLATGWLAAGITVHTTPITGILNNYVGGATSSGSVVSPAAQAKLDAACTLVGTPLYSSFLGAAATSSVFGTTYDLGDLFIVPPGGWVAVVGTGGSTGFWGSFTWEEVAP